MRVLELEWVTSILRGVLQGLAIGILSFGPSFFTLVNTGIGAGRYTAMRMALGIFASEFVVAMVCFFGLSNFFTNSYFQLGFSVTAAVLIIIYGIKSYITKYNHFLKNMKARPSSSASFFKGFLINILNPFAIMLWITILASVSVGYDNSIPNYKSYYFINVVSILFTLLALDLGKVFLSDILGKKISQRIYYTIQKYFGVILILLGIYFLYHFFHLLRVYKMI